MGRGVSVLALVAIFVAMVSFLVVTPTAAERANKSAAKDGVDLLPWKRTVADDLTDASVQDEEESRTDGGFSSLDGMLQWAIGNSDAEKLKEAALGIQHLTPEDLMQRHIEIKELTEKLHVPSDAELMKISIADLNNSSLSFEDRRRALQELLVLVEPIDNANDLHKLGGLTAVIKELDHRNSEIRTIAAWILGKASQNNPFVQDQVLDLGALSRLMEMARSNATEEAMKAPYAISALIRNNHKGQELFYKQDGSAILQFSLSHARIDIKLLKKWVALLTDLLESQLNARNHEEKSFFRDTNLLKSVVDLMSSTDLDLQEKTLHAVRNLLLLPYTDAIVFREICKLDVALDEMKQQLQKLLLDEDLKEYAQDVQNLRTEVERLFIGKLDDRNKALL